MDALQILEENSIPYRLQEHEAVFTVAESAHHLKGVMPVKNLLLKEEKGSECVLVVMKGDERLDTKLIARELGLKKLQFAKPDVLKEKLNVTPGSVSLFSMFAPSAKSVLLVLDDRLRNEKELGFHPNDNTKTIYISGKDTETILEINGIDYRWLDMTVASL